MNYRARAIITELLFQHALRIRITSERSSAAEERDGEESTEKNGHLIGKINNLVTSDLVNINEANKFWLMLRTYFHL